MHETEIALGRGIIKYFTSCNDVPALNLTSILQEFGFSKDDLVDLTMTYEELCEIHSLAKALHESVTKLK